METSSYGKRPLWQWILIYLVIGAILYGLIYYFVLSKRNGYSPNTGSSTSSSSQQPAQNGNTGY